MYSGLHLERLLFRGLIKSRSSVPSAVRHQLIKLQRLVRSALRHSVCKLCLPRSMARINTVKHGVLCSSGYSSAFLGEAQIAEESRRLGVRRRILNWQRLTLWPCGPWISSSGTLPVTDRSAF